MFFIIEDSSDNADIKSEETLINQAAIQLLRSWRDGDEQLRSNVIDSLERSLDENADVWAELARH